MSGPFQHILVERRGDVFCVRFQRPRLEEKDIYELADEVTALVVDDGCRKLALSLGGGDLKLLYSILLAKLVMIQKRVQQYGGHLKLCDANPEVHKVFSVCQLHTLFDFAPDIPTAVADFSRTHPPASP